MLAERVAPPLRSTSHPAPVWAAALLRVPFLLYGVLCVGLGIGLYLFGVLLVFPRYLLGLDELLMPLNRWIVWYSGMPIMAGLGLGFLDLFVLYDAKRQQQPARAGAVVAQRVTVVLTAYNDEDSIGPAVLDFAGHPSVQRVVVVSNNSADRTMERAAAAGAAAVNETQPGYGRCVFRCLNEALAHDDADLIVLCEGDLTFRSDDIDKLLAYARHADIVNGTRTVELLRQYKTQLSTFMYYGNLFVGKLLEAKHLGRATLTDVGTTYKLCHRDALHRLMPLLDPSVNLEFNAHLLDAALRANLSVVECPVTFHPRVGVSKGGNTSNGRAMKVGLRMMGGLLFGWRFFRA